MEEKNEKLSVSRETMIKSRKDRPTDLPFPLWMWV
jgi:hypothetical protein